MVKFLELDINYCAWGTLYKFALPKGKKISKVWGSYHNFHLAHQILVRPMELKRRHFIVLRVSISYSKGSKLQRYIRRKVD
jgi:hypothetical protein